VNCGTRNSGDQSVKWLEKPTADGCKSLDNKIGGEQDIEDVIKDSNEF